MKSVSYTSDLFSILGNRLNSYSNLSGAILSVAINHYNLLKARQSLFP